MNCQKTEGYFQASDHVRLFYRLSKAQPSRHICLLHHGKGEHSGRYDELTGVLNSKGVSTAIFDARGHGRSSGRHVYVDRLADYLADVSSFHRILEGEWNLKERVVVLGHSLGGLVATYWALQNQSKVKSLILSSPCFGVNLPSFLIYFNELVNAVAPGFTYNNPVQPLFLTHDPLEIEKYKKDPLIRRKISSRLLHEMVRSGNKLLNQNKLEFLFPVYLLLAGDEKIVSNDVTHSVFDKMISPEKQLIPFPGFYHEIFHEKDRNKAFDALAQVLDNLPSDS